MSDKGRINELDVFRGFAVLMVVLYHYTTRYNQLYGHTKEDYFLNFNFGNLGVQLFFIISGFVIFKTLERCGSVKEFAYKRAIRLYPIYIIGVVLTYLSVTLYQLEGRTVSLFDAIINLTLIEGLIPGKIEYVDGAYWSLTVELLFYIIMGFMLFVGLVKKIEIPLIAWLIFSMFIRYLDVNFDHIILTALNYYGILTYCNLFIAGIMFYKLKSHNKPIYHGTILLCLIPEFLFSGITDGVMVTVFFTLFYALIYGKLSFINSKKLTHLGTISYALYIVHQNLGYIIINFLEKNGFTHEIYILIPIIISVVIAYLITFYLDAPLQKILRKKMPAFSRNKTTKKVSLSESI